MALYLEEIKKYFATLEEETGAKFEVIAVDGANNMSQQVEQVNTFIVQNMDVIILNLVQTSSADALIDSVVNAGIPLVLINSEPLAYDESGNPVEEGYDKIVDNPYVCYVGCKAWLSGTFQGEIIADLPDHGDVNGDGEVAYVMIQGGIENPDTQYRTEYSIKSLKDRGINVKELDRQIGEFDQAKGQEIMANALSKYGDDIEVVFCNNDAMALGAYQSIMAAGRKVNENIYLVGVDALEECRQLIAEGEMTGTVLNDYTAQARQAVDVAVQCLKGEKIENYYWIPYQKITE